MRDLEQEIIDTLQVNQPSTFQAIFNKVGGCRTVVYNTHQKLIKDNIVIKTKDGSRLNENTTNLNLNEYLKMYNRQSEFYLKQLRKIKPVFKNVKIEKLETGGTSTSYWINPKARPILDNYILLIDDLSAINNALIYESIMIKKRIEVQKTLHDQKIFYTTMKNLVRKLRSRYHKNIIAIDNYLYWKSSTLRKLRVFQKN